jgi:peptidoglycan/xylan/chitin deacetylase (PgdA/CDA1 family)
MADQWHRTAALGLELLAASGAPRLARPASKARGVILTLHRVLPERPGPFAPTAFLQVTPDFLAFAIERVRQLGFDPVGMDEAVARIESDRPGKPFVAFTFDDAYRDNLLHALPVLRQQHCPFTLFVPTAFVDGVGELMEQALEAIVERETALAVDHPGGTEFVVCATLGEKRAAYERIYRLLRGLPEQHRRVALRSLAARYGLDLAAQCRSLVMDWQELGAFATEPLCTIGAHTVHHYALAGLTDTEARSEIEQSVRVIEAQFGRRPAHIAYPYGGPGAVGEREFAMVRELGLVSALTTRRQAVFASDRHSLQALPRVTLSGLYQSRRAFDVYLTPWLLRLVPGY